MSKRSIIVPCINGAIALLMASVVFTIQWPNLGPANWSPGQPFPHGYVPSTSETLVLLGIVIFPVACIFVGRSRWRALEIVGWLFLLILVVASFAK